MIRPSSVTNEDIARWSDNLDNDDALPKELAESPIIREVCYAGLWLHEELMKDHCPASISVRIRYSAAKLSYGHPNPWEVHQDMLTKYHNNELVFEDEEDVESN